jgi:peptidoglycan/xylan/chitin deacetylase (PgdA/CDA1 family)
LLNSIKPIQSRLKKVAREILFCKQAVISLPKAVVSFTFDDVPETALTNGMAILDKYGIKATFYLSMSKIADVPDLGILLRSAIENGHEMACHTYGHLRMTQSSAHQIAADLERNQMEFNRLVPQYAFKNFAYPYGLHSATAKSVVSRRFATARTVEGGVNVGTTDLNRLKAMKLYERLNKLDWVSHQIAEAANRKAWLIFYTHDVSADYSQYGCSPAYLESVVRQCLERDLTILPINKAAAIAH